MTTKTDEYRARLRALEEWDAFLLKESGLPGPRGNIEPCPMSSWRSAASSGWGACRQRATAPPCPSSDNVRLTQGGGSARRWP